MAQKPDGSAAKTERVTFTRPAAERIAKVVRAVEGGDRNSAPLRFGHTLANAANATIRSATFTGSWNIGAAKVVAYKYMSGTANAFNDLMDLPSAGTRNCVIGREGTAWRLINWQWSVAYAATGATLTSTALRFDAVPVGAVATSSTVTFSISATACTT